MGRPPSHEVSFRESMSWGSVPQLP
jgi:hypothetical protein